MTINQKSPIGKSLFLIALITMITVFIWIALEIFRTSKKTTIPQPTQIQMRPLSPKIDLQVFSLLKEKTAPSQEELTLLLTSPVIPSPEATDSSQVDNENDSLIITEEEWNLSLNK